MKEEIDRKKVSALVSDRMREIGQRVRCCRDDIHITQQDLAFWCFSDKCLISKIERGAMTNTTFSTLFKIADVLGQDVDYLITGRK